MLIRTVLLNLVIAFGALFLFFSCSRKTDMEYSGSYKNPPNLTIGLLEDLPSPVSGRSGDTVRFKIAGLDSMAKLNLSLVEFYINGIPSKVVSVNPDTTVSVIVPDYASSGAASMVVNNRLFFGPNFNIFGNIWVDSSFNTTPQKDELGNTVLGTGPNGTVRSLFYDAYLQDRDLYVVGYFSTWNGDAIYEVSSADGRNNYYRNVIQLDPANGAVRTNFLKGLGPNAGASINGMIPLTQFPGYLIYGSNFSSYNGYIRVRNMARVYRSGELDTLTLNVNNPNPDDANANIATFSNFLGGFDGGITKAFMDSRQRIISIGGFARHIYNDFALSTKYSVYGFLTPAKQVAAMDQFGNLDTTYNFDPTGLLNYGVNGTIRDAVQLVSGTTPGKIIIAGDFTTYNGEQVGRIVMLDDNGKRDAAFNVGSGANGVISKITYNPVTKKLLVVGNFTQFNGSAKPWGLVMLNENGTVDESLSLGEFVRSSSNSGQLINYAGQLNDGNIILSGAFAKYKGPDSPVLITREGFMILDPNGNLAPNLNNTGAFNGTIMDILESTTTSGKRALIIGGSFNLFDNKAISNLVRIGLVPK